MARDFDMDNEERIEKWRKERREKAEQNKQERLQRVAESRDDRSRQAVEERKKKAAEKEQKNREVAEAHLPSDQDIALEMEQAELRDRAARRRNFKLLAVFGLLPMAFILIYSLFIAAPLYETDATFTIDTVQDGDPMAGPGLLGIGGAGGSMSDEYKIREYLLSREVMRIMEEKHGFLAHFHTGTVNPLSRPVRMPLLGMDQIDFYKRRIKISVDMQQSLMKITVQARTPEDAVKYTNILLQLGKQKVSSISAMLNKDQLSALLEEKTRVEQQLDEANANVAQVQRARGDIDPIQTTTGIYEIISSLEVELAEQESQKRALLSNGLTNSPFLPRLNARISALKAQIMQQKSRLVGGRPQSVQRGLAAYEEALATKKIAETELESILRTIEQASLRSLQQRKYLIIVASPEKPTSAKISRLTYLIFLLLAGFFLITAFRALSRKI